MYQKAIPAGSAGIMAASYGMEEILKLTEVATPEPEETPVVPEKPIVEPEEPGE